MPVVLQRHGRLSLGKNPRFRTKQIGGSFPCDPRTKRSIGGQLPHDAGTTTRGPLTWQLENDVDIRSFMEEE